MLILFVWLLLVAQRLLELRRAGENERWLRQRGAQEFGARHYPLMVALHTFWFVAWLWEGWGRPVSSSWRLWLGLSVLGQLLRWTSILTLGKRWNTRVLVLPSAPPIERGLYRWIPHPNYVGVVLELAAVPLLFGAWKTALSVSLANAALLRVRIGIEDAALKGSLGEHQRPSV